MKNKRYLSPKFIGEGFSVFLFRLHKILLYALYTLLLSIPIVTAGGAHLALFAQIRKLADDENTDSHAYFAAFRSYGVAGIPYGVGLLLLVVGLSVPVVSGTLGFLLTAGCFLLYVLLLFYPAVRTAGYRGKDAVVRSVGYAASHAGETMLLVGLAVIFLFAALYLSEILLLLFYPLTFFVTARIVIANNEEEEKEEENLYEKVT